ncbi:mCG57199, partial [Mus musculus]
PPPPSATTATVTKWQLGARLASHRHTAGDCCPCTLRMPGHPGDRSPNGLVVQMARADGPVDPRRSRARAEVRLCLCALRPPTAGRHGPRGARSAAAVGEGWASGAPGNMAARPSTAASRPPVPEMRLGREVAEDASRGS